MWKTYEDYCEAMAKLNAEPLSREIWQREYSPKEEDEKPPLMVRPKKEARPVKPTLEQHIKQPKPKKPKAVKQPKERKHIHNRISLTGMTPEEVKAHRAKLQKNRMALKRANGWKEVRTPEQNEQRRLYFREYYTRMKDDPNFKEKRRKINVRHDEKRSESRKEKYHNAKNEQSAD